MKEYRMIKPRWRLIDIEIALNSLANEGWKVIQVSSDGYFLLEREKKK